MNKTAGQHPRRSFGPWTALILLPSHQPLYLIIQISPRLEKPRIVMLCVREFSPLVLMDA